jgi:hypothetical protein
MLREPRSTSVRARTVLVCYTLKEHHLTSLLRMAGTSYVREYVLTIARRRRTRVERLSVVAHRAHREGARGKRLLNRARADPRNRDEEDAQTSFYAEVCRHHV